MMTQQIDLRMRELTLLSGQGDPAVSQRAQYFIQSHCQSTCPMLHPYAAGA